jgi:hypothetical protein
LSGGAINRFWWQNCLLAPALPLELAGACFHSNVFCVSPICSGATVTSVWAALAARLKAFAAPDSQFSDSGNDGLRHVVSEAIKTLLKDKGTPKEWQCAAIEALLKQQNVVVEVGTGSGKSMTFQAIPAVVKRLGLLTLLLSLWAFSRYDNL